MPSPPQTNVTQSEWDILQALWEVERSTARELADRLRPLRGWAYSTVKTMLDRMASKGIVHSRRVGNVYEYTPAVERSAAQHSAWRRFVDTVFDGSMAPALQFIAQDAKLSRRQREQLVKLLEGEDKSGE